ncbi:carboxylesterase family protein, partial [Roseisolibacter sp. H3M3-2]|uniref:carboxylesterase/lipase family protein n=1 Tax=Roseisolibacter sp. H3M3-2 TaxID=3031323 RepID=UPI0023D9D49D
FLRPLGLRLRALRGVPFAAPPVGGLPRRAPRPAARWAGVRAADRFAHQCMQGRIYDDMVFRSAGTSEDCLYLNVWAPPAARDGAGALPVLVYFYGGGFQAGDGSEPRYDGAAMARRGMVVVTVNYRLGVFGFFAHPALTAESPERASGNYALMDQTAALRWVRDNVAAFGGDPARVTIAGESAGSFSVSAQMASPLARGLFAGAIGESGAFFSTTLATAPRADVERAGERFADSVGARTLAALRALSATELLDASARRGMPRFGPSVDGHFLPRSPAEVFAAGAQARVPLLAGWNSEEAGAGAVLGQAPATPENARAALERLFPGRGEEAARVYPVGTAAEAARSMTDLAGDRFIGYSTWKWLEEHARTSGRPVWRYLFARARPPEVANPQAPPARGAVHSAEIEYALGNLGTNRVFAWTPDDHRVSEVMQRYFANFVRTGDPNGAGLPPWPSGAARAGEAPRRLVIDVETRAEPEPRARYLFLDAARR